MKALPELAPVRTRGIDHLAFVTDDLPATMDFYTRVLGMQLVHVRRVPYERDRGQPPYENLRHYFFNMGNDSLLAFFEIPKGREPAGLRNAIGAMQHCAFVVTPQRFAEIEARLQARGIAYNGPIPQLPGLLGIYFYDPNGIRLEFACQPADGADPAVVRCVLQTKAEAAAELRSLPGVDDAWLARYAGALPD
jgi:catechol 2,3-dioxygenase-like lactoylglutathione lyase family enzyme